MGNSPLTVCIQQVWEKQTVQVVLPDGQVLFMPHPLTASMLMEAHPYHFVCQGSPSLLEQRLPMNTRLESDQIYYLLPIPRPHFNTNPSSSSGLAPRVTNLAEKVAYKPSLLFDKSSSSFSRLNLRPQQCLINLFLFRQSVASIMPEESFNAVPASPPQGGGGAGSGGGNHHNNNYHYGSHFLANRYHHQRSETRPKVRGRKQAIPWKPQLESISETRPWHDFSTKNYINDFSVSMISSIKALASSPQFPTSLHGNRDLLLPYGEQHRMGVIQGPLHDDQDAHRQRVIYSA